MGKGSKGRGGESASKAGPLAAMKVKLLKSDMDRHMKQDLIKCIKQALKVAPHLSGLAQVLQMALNHQVRESNFRKHAPR